MNVLSDTEKVSRAYLRILNWYVDGCYQSLFSITKQLLKQMKLWEILASSWQTCNLQHIPFPVCFLNSSHTKKPKQSYKKNQHNTHYQNPSTILEIHTYNILQVFKLMGEEIMTLSAYHTEFRISSHLTKHSIPTTEPRSVSNQQKYLLAFGDSFGENKQPKCVRFL